MGIYLNGKNAYGLFQEAFSLTYFVDKTGILNELIPILDLKKNTPEPSLGNVYRLTKESGRMLRDSL